MLVAADALVNTQLEVLPVGVLVEPRGRISGTWDARAKPDGEGALLRLTLLHGQQVLSLCAGSMELARSGGLLAV